jgi:hypothetical protein
MKSGLNGLWVLALGVAMLLGVIFGASLASGA